MNKSTSKPSIDQLLHEIKVNEHKYEMAVSKQKNYAILKRIRERIKILKGTIQFSIPT
jgi:hypothetical protein